MIDGLPFVAGWLNTLYSMPVRINEHQRNSGRGEDHYEHIRGSKRR
jgi:hypothetical protein